MTPSDEILDARTRFNQLMAAPPPPAGVTVEQQMIGGVRTLRVSGPGTSAAPTTLLFLHGGAHIAGSPEHVISLAARLAGRLGATALIPDFRLAPEHPFPADVDDVLSVYETIRQPSRAILAGESSGGGLVVSTLLALRERGLEQPAAAYAMSPWADLTMSGTSYRSKEEVDGVLSAAAVEPLAASYAGARDRREISPVFADLHGLAPMVLQAGSYEVLLDDAVRLGAAAAAADVAVQLDVAAGMRHVFQNRPEQFSEADLALDRAAAFLLAHLPA